MAARVKWPTPSMRSSTASGTRRAAAVVVPLLPGTEQPRDMAARRAGATLCRPPARAAPARPAGRPDADTVAPRSPAWRGCPPSPIRHAPDTSRCCAGRSPRCRRPRAARTPPARLLLRPGTDARRNGPRRCRSARPPSQTAWAHAAGSFVRTWSRCTGVSELGAETITSLPGCVASLTADPGPKQVLKPPGAGRQPAEQARNTSAMTNGFDKLLRESLTAEAAADHGAECLDAAVVAGWFDGTLSHAERTAVEAHAATCSRCQATIAALVRTDRPAPRAWWRAPAVQWLVPVAVAGAASLIIWIAVLRPDDGGPPPSATSARLEFAATAPAVVAGSARPEQGSPPGGRAGIADAPAKPAPRPDRGADGNVADRERRGSRNGGGLH